MSSTTNALAAPLSGVVLRLPDFSSVFRAVEGWFRSAELSADDAATLRIAIWGCGVAGRRVLSAQDREDFDDQIEAVLRDPEYYSSLARMFALGARPAGDAPQLPSARGAEEQAALFVEALGEGALLPVLKGFRHLMVISDAAKRIGVRENSGVDLQSFLSRSVDSPLWFVADPATSVHGARVLLATLKVTVCLFTIGQVFFARCRVDPWLAHALAEHWQSDTYVVLRYVASVPGSNVPDEVVPISDRFNLGELEEDEKRSRQRIDALFQKAGRNA